MLLKFLILCLEWLHSWTTNTPQLNLKIRKLRKEMQEELKRREGKQ